MLSTKAYRRPISIPLCDLRDLDPQNGERTIFTMAKRFKPLKPGDIPLDAVRRVKLVIVDGFERAAVPTLLETARAAGCAPSSILKGTTGKRLGGS